MARTLPYRLKQQFKDVNQLLGMFWLYIAIGTGISDVPLLWSSTMTTVRHLLNYYKGIYGNHQVTLVVRRRSYCARSMLTTEKITNIEVNINYNITLLNLIEKSYLSYVFKLDRIVEILGIIICLKSKE
jgi:hypothetical protein